MSWHDMSCRVVSCHSLSCHIILCFVILCLLQQGRSLCESMIGFYSLIFLLATFADSWHDIISLYLSCFSRNPLNPWDVFLEMGVFLFLIFSRHFGAGLPRPAHGTPQASQASLGAQIQSESSDPALELRSRCGAQIHTGTSDPAW